jgi:cytochrome c553
MPSEQYGALNDDDLAKIVAFLKTLPQQPGPDVQTSLGPLGRVGIALGKFKLVPQIIADTPPPPERATSEGKRGRYLVRTTCGGCHGPDLKGTTTPAFVAPDLAAATAYSAEAFAKLMKDGTGVGGRQLVWMPVEARNHLSLLNDGEVASMHAYLRALPQLRGLGSADRHARPGRLRLARRPSAPARAERDGLRHGFGFGALASMRRPTLHRLTFDCHCAPEQQTHTRQSARR